MFDAANGGSAADTDCKLSEAFQSINKDALKRSSCDFLRWGTGPNSENITVEVLENSQDFFAGEVSKITGQPDGRGILIHKHTGLKFIGYFNGFATVKSALEGENTFISITKNVIIVAKYDQDQSGKLIQIATQFSKDGAAANSI